MCKWGWVAPPCTQVSCSRAAGGGHRPFSSPPRLRVFGHQGVGAFCGVVAPVALGVCRPPSSSTPGVALAVHCCVLSFPQSLVAIGASLPTHHLTHILCFHPKPPRTQDLRAGARAAPWLPTLALLAVPMQATTMLALTLLILVKMSDEGTQSPHLEALGGDKVRVAGAEASPPPPVPRGCNELTS